MEIYLFGTYENSMRGYVLNRLEEEDCGRRRPMRNQRKSVWSGNSFFTTCFAWPGWISAWNKRRKAFGRSLTGVWR